MQDLDRLVCVNLLGLSVLRFIVLAIHSAWWPLHLLAGMLGELLNMLGKLLGLWVLLILLLVLELALCELRIGVLRLLLLLWSRCSGRLLGLRSHCGFDLFHAHHFPSSRCSWRLRRQSLCSRYCLRAGAPKVGISLQIGNIVEVLVFFVAASCWLSVRVG